MKNVLGGRIILLLIAVLVVAVSVFVLINRDGSKATHQQSGIIANPGSAVAEANRNITSDPDNDGLADWEEVLWGTDKNNPDTDGDGTNDGDEVAEKRNPTKSGSDYLTLTTNQNSTSTLTAQFSRDLLGQYLLVKDTGTEVDTSIENDIIGSLLSSDYLSIPVEQYVVSDININNNITLEEYANTVGLLFVATSGKKGDKNEIQTLNEYAATENPDILMQLQGPFNRYTELKDVLLKIEVPTEMLSVHLSLLNNIESIRSGLVGLQRISTDAVLAIASLNLYQTGARGIVQTLANAQAIYTEKNISFEENEAGYIFLYGL